MRKSITLSLFCLFFVSVLHAKNIELTEAVKKGYIEIYAESEGGHTGKCLKLKIKNFRKKKINIEITAGLIKKGSYDFGKADPRETMKCTSGEMVINGVGVQVETQLPLLRLVRKLFLKLKVILIIIAITDGLR